MLSRLSVRRRAVARAALALCAALQIHAVAAQPLAFDIAAQPLPSALAALARQAGLQLAFAPELAQGRQAPGVRGTHEVPDALRALLAGSGLQGRVQGRTLVIERAAVSGEGAALPAVTVQASGDASTEGSGSYTARSMSTATGLALSMRETPQSVSVLTRQQIEDQGLTTLDEAVQNVTGLIVQKGYYVGDSGSFSARGFPVSNILLDGLPTSTGANGTFNADNDSLDIYDRVEVVRGATGLTTGAGTPSAAINLVRKRPTAERQGSVTLSAGSWNQGRAALDAGGPLNAAGTLRGRAVVTVEDTKRFYDVAHDRNHQFYGILEADLTRDTVATLGAHYRKVDNQGGLARQPTLSDGRFLPGLDRATNLSNDFDYWKQADKTLFADLTHHFANGWKAKLAANWKRSDQDMVFAGLGFNGGALRQNTQRYRLDNAQDSYDLALNGPFQLFGRSHELMMGASYRKRDNVNWGGWPTYAYTSAAPVVSPYFWNPSALPMPLFDMERWKQINTVRQKSVYAATRINATDRLKFVAGARVNWYDHDQHSGFGKDFSTDREVTPYFGAIFDLNDNHSVYASWTEIFAPQSAYDRSGDLLPPITGRNYEAGIKGEYFDRRLNASLAAFLVQQRNRATNDLNGPNPCPGSTGGYCQRASGEVESKGVELEVSGALTPDWQLTAGYTYVKAVYTEDADTRNIGQPFNATLPKHQFKLSTSYRLPGEWGRWRVGGTVYAQSRVESKGSIYLIAQGGYVTAGLSAAYALSPQTELRLNVNNLFDRHYYQSIGWTNGGNVFGAPRNVLATLQHRF
ncbi:MAG: TonB-dependent siderophore receptor [Comamonadaceae bacterium]|nr:MAG: TonB-dependent siderophore receptor [Comamonadaceae bacterium]